MASIREIHKKVESISSTRKITGAMEMVAVSKMRRSQERMNAARPYADRILSVVQHLSEATPQYQPALMKVRPPVNVAYILIGSDKGLCGGLNHNLFRIFLQHLQEHTQVQPEGSVRVCAIGQKAAALCKRLRLNHYASEKLGEYPTSDKTLAVIQAVLQLFEQGSIDRIYLLRNRFINTVSQKPEMIPLVPLEPLQQSKKTASWDYLYEPDPELLLDRLLHRYVESLVHGAVLENYACEQAAKMVAMKNATENAGELIDQLQLAYNNARQAAITAELADIIGGAEAV
ncbi:MAG: ATP synthase F1 subunit gamma [Gammaproteobacteria bacterium]